MNIHNNNLVKPCWTSLLWHFPVILTYQYSRYPEVGFACSDYTSTRENEKNIYNIQSFRSCAAGQSPTIQVARIKTTRHGTQIHLKTSYAMPRTSTCRGRTFAERKIMYSKLFIEACYILQLKPQRTMNWRVSATLDHFQQKHLIAQGRRFETQR